jgi:hypothetical protein
MFTVGDLLLGVVLPAAVTGGLLLVVTVPAAIVRGAREVRG